MPLVIRPYNDARDRGAMTALYRSAWHAAYDAVDGVEAIDTLIAALLEGEPPQMFDLGPRDMALVAERAGQLLGGVRGHPCDGFVHVSGMYVLPGALRGGVGRALMLDLFKRFRPGTVVRADVRPTSAPALAFYERLGFIQIGRTTTHIGGGRMVAALQMQRVVM